jgi:hypothetical protein
MRRSQDTDTDRLAAEDVRTAQRLGLPVDSSADEIPRTPKPLGKSVSVHEELERPALSRFGGTSEFPCELARRVRRARVRGLDAPHRQADPARRAHLGVLPRE